MTRPTARTLAAAMAVAATLACSESTSSAASSMTFRIAVVSPSVGTSAALSVAFTQVPIVGSNGTLTIEQIWMVVDEFRLERVPGTCDVSGNEPDEDCARFEAPPAFLPVSLDGTTPGTVAMPAAAGTYEELKFETREPRADGVLLAEIRQQFPDWPEDASQLMVGTFTPVGGTAIPFRAYFHGEVLVELAFDEPLEVVAGGDQTVAVFVDPAIWFVQSDGSVLDLTQFDFDATGEVAELEAKFQEGFTKIEVD